VEDAAIDVGVVTLPVKSSSLHESTDLSRSRPAQWWDAAIRLSPQDSFIERDAQQPLVLPTIGATRRIMEKNLRPYRENLNITMELTAS